MYVIEPSVLPEQVGAVITKSDNKMSTPPSLTMMLSVLVHPLASVISTTYKPEVKPVIGFVAGEPFTVYVNGNEPVVGVIEI